MSEYNLQGVGKGESFSSDAREEARHFHLEKPGFGGYLDWAKVL
jgi:hypothetical protein